MKIDRVFKVILTDDERHTMKEVADIFNKISNAMNSNENYEGFELGDFNFALDIIETIISENE